MTYGFVGKVISATVIRPCVAGDLDPILCIEKESFAYPYNPSVFRHYFNSSHAKIFVAEVQGGVAGYVITEVRPSGKGVVVSIAVDSKHRRKGFGSLLLLKALETLRRDVKEVELQVGVSNEAAQRFYLKHGFGIEGILNHYYPNGEDAYVMRLRFG